MKSLFLLCNAGCIRTFGLIAGMAFLTGSLGSLDQLAADEATKLVVTVLQDEPLRLPKDNTALITSRSPRIRMSVQYLADTGLPSETQLTLVTPTGQEQELVPDDDGNFTIPNPIAGLYAVVAKTATSAIASIPFYAKQIADDDPLVDAVAESDQSVNIPVIPEGRVVVEELAEQYVSYQERGDIEPVRYEFETDELHGYQVRMTSDGRVPGRVIIASEAAKNRGLLADNNLFLLRNGIRLQNVLSDASGDFVFSDMTPGVYGLVAAGPAGYTAFSFEVLPSNAFTNTDRAVGEISEAGFVLNRSMAPASVLPVVMIPPELVPAVLEIQRRDRVDAAGFPAEGVSTPIASNGAGFGSPGFGGNYGGGGFGGGSGGLGGIGEIAGLAGLAGILAASDIFDDDDDPTFTPINPPISPFLP